MSANSMSTIATHVPAWIGLHQHQRHEVATSDRIASSANINAVVMRRLLGDLRKAGLVESRCRVGAGVTARADIRAMWCDDVAGEP